MSVKDLRKRIENAKKKTIPFDLFGKYYDSLSSADKMRYWEYVYKGVFTLERAEELEIKYISGTLHFICDMTLFDSLDDPMFVEKMKF